MITHTSLIVAVAALTALRIGFERPSVIPIHCGLISSYTAGLAVYGEINILDKFIVHNRYCIQFCFFAFNGFTLIHCRNLGSRLYTLDRLGYIAFALVH